MPVSIDRSTEVALTTMFDATFISELKRYLGLDPDTASEDLPISVEDLLAEAVSTCEMEQWRFILPKEVTLTLPAEAICEEDRLVFLPYGKASSVAMTYKNLSNVTTSWTDFEILVGEPIRLFSENWSTLYNSLYTEHPYPITVVYTPGYTTYSEIPKSTIHALKILTYHYNEIRDTLSEAGTKTPTPQGYEHNRNHDVLNDYRALRYILDDRSKVSPR